jgi:hypothetical protein
MIEKDDSSYYSFSCQDGECLRTVEVKKTSDDEVLHKKLYLPSSLEKRNTCKTSLEKDVHSKEGMNMFPTGKWPMYPCASCGNSNHDMCFSVISLFFAKCSGTLMLIGKQLCGYHTICVLVMTLDNLTFLMSCY